MNLSELLGTTKVVGATNAIKDGDTAERSLDGEAFSESVNALSAGEDAPTGDSSARASQDGTDPKPSNETPVATDEAESTAAAGPVNALFVQPAPQPQKLDPSISTLVQPEAGMMKDASRVAADGSRSDPAKSQATVITQKSAASIQVTQTATLSGAEAKNIPSAAVPLSLDASNVDQANANNRGLVATAQTTTGAENSLVDRDLSNQTTTATTNQSQTARPTTPEQSGTLQQPTTTPASAASSATSVTEAPIYSRATATRGDASVNSQEQKPDTNSQTQTSADPIVDDQLADQRRVQRREDVATSDQKSEQNRLNHAVATQQAKETGAISFGTSQATRGAAETSPATQASSDPMITGMATGTREGTVDRAAAANFARTASAELAGRNTVSQITAAIRNKPLMQIVELSLDPPELGRIEIQMEVAEVGLKATLSAERSTTGDLIRRQADLLLQQLDEAGFSDVDLDFRDFGSGENNGGDGEQSGSGRSGELVEAPASLTPNLRTPRISATNGMDVRL